MEYTEDEMKEIQYIIDRINYIATLPNDQIQGDKPKWVCFNAQEADDIEGMPKYIIPTVREHGNIWSPMRLCDERDTFAYYHNGTNTWMKMYKDDTSTVYERDGLVFDYTEISRLEYLRFYWKISEKYVTSYNLKEKE
jgi:hypothetical protein